MTASSPEEEEVEEEARTVQVQAGTLYVVATPIGNLNDMTVRAVNVLKQVDVIASEDTRHLLSRRTGRMLKHFDIKTPQISHHEHNRQGSVSEIVNMARAGRSIAIVSDAGTPAISDPGTEVVRACLQEGIRVEPIPGACAAVAAVSISGMAKEGFCFGGFIPAKGSMRQQFVERVVSSPSPMVLYEAPHRLLATLEDLCAHCPDRDVIVARELTKIHEEVFAGKLREALSHFQKRSPRGEFTLVIEGNASPASSREDDSLAARVLRSFISHGIPVSSAVKAVAELFDVKKNRLKQFALDFKQEQEEEEEEDEEDRDQQRSALGK
ncbi:hypothetical protein GUITHDRAFT_67488 [Guillardia theta CCMP2712]|uniref:Tetrapyrrole methylase domain-containing protein n=1 Tax=Guillardia theta (strain CCMP2712) TaxID=905079 RepID=L1JP24_GUITC|nr:hypothetical protein GUITHDRAFT_67488 [Guillardia theta CCMP2712]EKX50044.1 hypothetical protein GUITHDRAFT_67488 [Guillardia theta CCMP2712]|eukprot:XP_005837024.1 hypothetical protein GUITHDRAFT_67488 [Guillardia theta CCMP2712]